MTVGENVQLPLREHTQLDEQTIGIMTRMKLDMVNLHGFENLKPAELSGGMLKRAGLAILITDHNVRETLEIVDRAYLIYEGQVLREGTQEFLINDPVSRELYLGDRFRM